MLGYWEQSRQALQDVGVTIFIMNVDLVHDLVGERSRTHRGEDTEELCDAVLTSSDRSSKNGGMNTEALLSLLLLSVRMCLLCCLKSGIQ